MGMRDEISCGFRAHSFIGLATPYRWRPVRGVKPDPKREKFPVMSPSVNPAPPCLSQKCSGHCNPERSMQIYPSTLTIQPLPFCGFSQPSSAYPPLVPLQSAVPFCWRCYRIRPLLIRCPPDSCYRPFLFPQVSHVAK